MSRRFGIRFDAPDPAPSPQAVAAEFDAAPGLYLHIPFCQSICPFCPYNKVRYEADLAADYLRNLEREASMHLAARPGSFPSVYVGGGTPTLCLDELAGLLERLPITGERAIEVLPPHLTGPRAKHLSALGFDYVSLGVQSFNEQVLRQLRRPGTPDTSRTAIETALGTFDCVDVDLIFDTGYDDRQTLLDDLDLCFRYGVHQVSTYPLMRFGYTPFGKGQHHHGREHALLRAATELAQSYGYERRSVWTFNRAGAPSYTSITRPYYLGLGAGAASFAGGVFLVNHFGLEQYRRALAEGHLPVARIARLPGPAAAAYRAFWQAYTGTMPVKSHDPLLDHPVSMALRDVSRMLGWSRRVGDTVALTDSGYDRYHDLERWVTYHLIEPLWAEMMAEHDPPPTSAPGGGST
ncbi:MAG: radical SAM protein [Dactylosporangium sp.]|nr:radical SAM protein [Dactylosporangium sp.]NNJ61302.1 radical SAM protein [Dactylosporangium sp.]